MGAFGVLGAIGTAVFQATLEAGKDVFLPPLRVTMVDTRGAPEFLFPRTVDPRDAPLGFSDYTAEFIDWAETGGGVAYGCQGFKLVIEGRDASPVTITNVRIDVLTHQPLDGHWVNEFEFGAALPVRQFKADFKEPDPRLRLYRNGQPVLLGAFKVSDSEPEVFRVEIKAGHGTFSWVMKIDYSTEGRSGTFEVDDNGSPFELAGGGNPLRYVVERDNSAKPPRPVLVRSGRMKSVGDLSRRFCI